MIVYDNGKRYIVSVLNAYFVHDKTTGKRIAFVYTLDEALKIAEE